MSSFRVSNINFKKAFMAFAVVVAAIAPGLTAFVSAAQIENRSIALSSAAASATNVSYDINFTATQSAGAFTVEFCDSPVIGTACAPVTGFTAAGANVSTASATDGFTATGTATKVTVEGTMAAGPVQVELVGINNPTQVTNLYARIISYVDGDAATAATSPLDTGSVALAFTDKIGVSAAVPETMSFCVSNQAIDPDCAPGTVSAPTVKLGETVGTQVALVAGTVSKASIYSQISTNAANGAVVNLKSNATDCGGLIRTGAPTKCDIGPATIAGIDGSTALFGVKVTGAAQTAAGIFQTAGSYNATDYFMGFTIGNTAGVTSTYGDEILNTDGKPANNKNATLEFGATVTNSTPAGLYTADLSLIATGKF